MEGSSSSYVHVLTTLLILLAFTSYVSLASGAVAGKSSTEFIRKSCRVTIYPKLCFTSLSGYASAIQTSPKYLAYTALSVTLDAANYTSSVMKNLSRSHGMKPREVAAMGDCVELLSASVDQLRESLGEMNQIKEPNFEQMMSDIKTWVSAALTDDDTCMDGFAEKAMDGNLKTVVRGRVLKIAQLTSNALALINTYASLHV
ncbi:21 kDa protein-like [Cornus florida]|uniref:21 kDa protein-like n=1 Tax=Cornus florida TaxID=4283 RepID=UPI00289A5641|nr:21 kDa protein-like [Cornus florida]